MGPTVPIQVGDLVAGKYRLERELGSGGMGVVFAAMHVHLQQRVALKFLFDEAAENPELVERFWREARAAVKITSEHVARVMDIGQLDDSGTPYIVMEYLEGDDLENIVKAAGPLPVGDAICYLLQACEALAEVHAQGIVHRDIKPANLFIANRANGSAVVKVLDFGISKAAPAWSQQQVGSLTNTSAVIGSPRYMSPEQLRSSRDVDLRADIWALGVTLFELLGGKSPFARGTMPEVCASILKDEPLSLVGLRPGIEPALETVIRRCLSKEPDKRYRNVAELAMALRPFGPHGIIDISIERVVGIVQMSMMQAPPPADDRRKKPSTAPTAYEGRTTTPARSEMSTSKTQAPTTPPLNKPHPAAAKPTTNPPASKTYAVTTPRTTPPQGTTVPPSTKTGVPPSSTKTTGPPPAKTITKPPVETFAKASEKMPKLEPEPSRADTRKTPDELERHYLARIGPRKQIPRVVMEPSQITKLALDHRCGFLLSLVDGGSSIDELLDVSGMARIETLRLICELLDHGVLALTPPQRSTKP